MIQGLICVLIGLLYFSVKCDIVILPICFQFYAFCLKGVVFWLHVVTYMNFWHPLLAIGGVIPIIFLCIGAPVCGVYEHQDSAK